MKAVWTISAALLISLLVPILANAAKIVSRLLDTAPSGRIRG